MANIDDFGISASTLNAAINPSQTPHSIWVGPAYTGQGTGNSAGAFNMTGNRVRSDLYNDFHLYFASDKSFHLITDTAGGTLTTGSNLASRVSASYEIRANDMIATADAMTTVRRIVGEVKAQLPEKYRRMLYEVDSELIVEWAQHQQATAHTTFQVADSTKLHLWRNWQYPLERRTLADALYSPKDVANGLSSTADYTVGTASQTVITFRFGGQSANKLGKDDSILARYTHSLPTVPKIVQQIALHISAYEIMWGHGLGQAELQGHITEHRDRAYKLIEDLREGKIGIEEFDNLKLYDETRTPVSPGRYGVVETWRA